MSEQQRVQAGDEGLGGETPGKRPAGARESGATGSGHGGAAGRGPSEPPELVKHLQRRREAYRQRGIAYRVAWVIASVIVIAAGIVMIVFPGPALVVIPIGLAMLSLEFAWAQRLLDRTLERGIDAKDMAKNASRRQKAVGVAAGACLIAAVAAAAIIILT